MLSVILKLVLSVRSTSQSTRTLRSCRAGPTNTAKRPARYCHASTVSASQQMSAQVQLKLLRPTRHEEDLPSYVGVLRPVGVPGRLERLMKLRLPRLRLATRVDAPATRSLIIALYISESAVNMSRNMRWYARSSVVWVESACSSLTRLRSAGSDWSFKSSSVRRVICSMRSESTKGTLTPSSRRRRSPRRSPGTGADSGV